MADIAFGSVGKIIKIALKIKEAVKTVKQNQQECRDIQRCVARVSAILRKLDEMTETMKDEAMRDALEDLAESLERALDLVTECQQKHAVRRFLGAGDMAKELRRVQQDIMMNLDLGNFATNVQILQNTIMLTNIQSAGGPPPLPPPPRRVIIDGFTMFNSSELKAATENFSEEKKIGSGGFGEIYKGVLQEGQVVAIKMLFPSPTRYYSELYDEINVFVHLKHKNIIRPLGYCHEITMVLVCPDGKYFAAESHEFYFVEEYMGNGSMRNIINGSRLIDWSCRFKMIQGIAQGLHYLHERSVVHMDLKPENILFDAGMNPRICDFGVAKKLDQLDEEDSRDTIAGTLGYMPPEYLSNGTVSTKCDVFAFGITLLRTIIGSMCISTHDCSNDEPIHQWAFNARDDVRMELFKPSLCREFQLMQIKRCMEVGLLCIEFDKEDRPTMEDVLEMLSGMKELPALKQPYGTKT